MPSPFRHCLTNLLALALVVAARSETAPTVRRYCLSCHDAETQKGKIDLESILADDPAVHSDIWERATRQMRAHLMPPAGKKQPDEQERQSVITSLESRLDVATVDHPNPGRTSTIRRLTRTEYQSAIRDLLDLDVDAITLLPQDELSHGFDNVTVGELSPTLLDSYITAAQRIAKLAVGGALRGAGGETIRVRPDITQEQHVEGLPPGTRGGILINHHFPQTGDFEVQVRLTRDRNEHVEGLREPHELVFLLDGKPATNFTVKPPKGQDHQHVDDHLKLRLPATAGPHELGVTFVQTGASLQETIRQPYNTHFNFHRHPRLTPAVYQVSIVGPFDPKGPGDTPSRRRIFFERPKSSEDEPACAKRIIAALMKRAWRRAINDADLEQTMAFYRDARKEADFETGIEAALSAILVSREFLFRVEQDPANAKPHTPYRLADVQLASRLSFFLWSSIPDDELLDVAIRNELHDPQVLAQQTQRMLRDPRAQSLVTNFASQWLYLGNLDSITPDARLFPDFDDNLRQAMRRETEMLFEEVLHDDRSVLDLLRTDHTFLNERLAKHYGIPHIYGSEFRRVPLESSAHRGGLLRQGSFLTVTSYATRTSPVIRGHWILKNLLGTQPPPPPPNVPALDGVISESLPIRERLAKHRADPACASCHAVMDPVGFALENFDAIGRWRDVEGGRAIDAGGGLPDGSTFDGVEGLEAGLLAQPEIFVTAMTEKLLTFALGRGVEPSDAPAVRAIVRKAKKDGFRLSLIISSIVQSPPFTMRSTL